MHAGGRGKWERAIEGETRVVERSVGVWRDRKGFVRLFFLQGQKRLAGELS